MDARPGLTPSQQEQLLAYWQRVATSPHNLVAPTDREREAFFKRHIEDCLRLLPGLQARGAHRVIDVGSGGGLPAVILAIALPELQVTALEATGKKAAFIRETAEALGLAERLHVVEGRAESQAAVGAPLREQFDVAVARAVAPLPVLLELLAGFVRPGGWLLAMKGARASQELAASMAAISTLGLRAPELGDDLLWFEKPGTLASHYPRKTGQPNKRPL